MRIHIGLEKGMEGRSIAWALDYPGCYANGPDANTALVSMGHEIPNYITWLEKHTDIPWFNPESIDIFLAEVSEDYHLDDQYQRAEQGYEVNAWFNHDWKVLNATDVEHGLQLLSWTRADLLALIHALDFEIMEARKSPESWSISQILSHVGNGDWWYLSRINLAGCTRDQLPQDRLERLNLTRKHFREVLPGLINKDLVLGKQGEIWSPRKVLRRAVWHERDHTQQIRDILFSVGWEPDENVSLVPY